MSPVPLIVVSLCAVIRTTAADPGAMIFPGAAWGEATPESQQMDSAKLGDAVAFPGANSGKDAARNWSSFATAG